MLLLACLSVFAVALVAALAWLHWLNVTPTVTIPTPRLPVPNARDYYIAAGFAVVRNADVERAIGEPGADLGPDGRRLPPMTHAEREALLRENAPALGKLRQGFAYEYWETPARSWNTSFSHYSRYRNLARLLRLEAQIRAARGDWSGAMGTTLDAMRLGEDSGRGSPLVGMLAGVSVQRIVRKDAWAYARHLDATESRRAARRLEDVIERHFAFADTLQEEKWAGQAGLLELFRDRNWQRSLVRMMYDTGHGPPPSPDWEELKERARMLRVSKTKVMADYSAYTDGLIANARQPYAAKLPPPRESGNPVIDYVLPTVHRRFDEVHADTMNRLLLLSVALRAAQAERGRYPERLEELMPSYVRRLPGDAFALSGTLHYRRTASGYLLYSLGPDSMDNGGTPAVYPYRPRGSPGWLQVFDDSTGDIVAGVNY